MKRKICAILAIGCAIIIVGAVGALELDTLSISETIKRCAIAFPVMTISLSIGGFFK
jgi:hypothetical protein